MCSKIEIVTKRKRNYRALPVDLGSNWLEQVLRDGGCHNCQKSHRYEENSSGWPYQKNKIVCGCDHDTGKRVYVYGGYTCDLFVEKVQQ